VLLFSLIALVVLMLAASALMQSFNNSLFTAGNIAFKRDLQNQSERAADLVLTQFRPGGTLALSATRAANLATSNYSATLLPVNAQGIPTALALSNTAFAAAWSAPDIDVADQGISVRYVIDRMCPIVGDEKVLGSACVLTDDTAPAGGSASNLQGAEKTLGGQAGASSTNTVYRLTVRVNGPRNTQSFFQSTFAVPTAS